MALAQNNFLCMLVFTQKKIKSERKIACQYWDWLENENWWHFLKKATQVKCKLPRLKVFDSTYVKQLVQAMLE